MSFAIALAVSASSPTVTTASIHRWNTYHNARFGTQADYPADVFKMPVVSENGDGARWTSDVGAKLLIFGSWNSLKQTSVSYARFLTELKPQRYRRVSYRLIKPGSLTLSGTVSGNIFYERYVFGDPSGAIHALVLEYPILARALVDPLLPRMSSKLRWSNSPR